MKKAVKAMLVLSLLLVIFLCLPQRVSASQGTYQGLKYKVENGKVTITGSTDSLSGKVTIPEKIEGCPVTAIGRMAFYKNKNITSVVLPDSVTTIGGEEAFAKCENLTSIYFGSGIVSIGSFSFEDCINIEKVYISDLRAWCNAEIKSYPMRYGADLYLNGEKVTDLVIPEGVTGIRPNTFQGCKSIKSVTLHKGVTEINEYAFDGCENLTKITGKDALISIGKEAFKNCGKLTEISLKGITSSAGYAFKNCSALKYVEISDIDTWSGAQFTTPQSNPLYYAKKLYVNGEVLTELELSEKLTAVGANAFYNCTSLKTVYLPEKVTKIGDRAFQNCTGLTQVVIGNISPTICDDAFAGCKNLQTVRYRGTEEEHKQVGIGSGNQYLTNAAWEYLVHKHVYDNDCDDACNICGKRRWWTATHFYDNGCDDVCNSCGETRTKIHTYDGFWDAECNICSYIREIEESVQTTGKLQLALRISFCGISQSFTVKAQGVVLAIVVLSAVTIGVVAVLIVRHTDEKKFNKKEGA